MAGQLVPEKVKLLLGVFALQLCFAGFIIVSRAALDLGVSQIVFIVYRNFIAVILLAPFAYFLEKKDRPPLTFSLLVQFFLLALSGVCANQGLYLMGLYYLSPTFVSAIQNSAPAITFALAAALRFEIIDIAKIEGLAKVVGTIASVVGATVITLYKGPLLLHRQQSNPYKATPLLSTTSPGQIKNWTLGCVYMMGSCIAWSFWLVHQVPVLKKYPAIFTVSTFTCFFGGIQFLIIAAFLETDIEHWKVHSQGELLTILYAGIVASGMCLALQTWCICRGGPVFVAVFQPIETVAVAVMASIVFGDQLYTGGIIGAIIIVIGLYLVLWGKFKENRAGNESSVHLTEPLIYGENSHLDGAVTVELPSETCSIGFGNEALK